MNRYEYNVLLRVVVKADSRESADQVYRENLAGQVKDFVVGEVVTTEKWWQLPSENYLEAAQEPPLMPERKEHRARIEKKAKAQGLEVIPRLKAFVESGKMKKGQIAKAIGVSPASMQAWLVGRWSPGPNTVQQILVFLDQAEEGQG